MSSKDVLFYPASVQNTMVPTCNWDKTLSLHHSSRHITETFLYFSIAAAGPGRCRLMHNLWNLQLPLQRPSAVHYFFLCMFYTHKLTLMWSTGRVSFQCISPKSIFFFFLDRISSPETQATVTALEKPQLCTPKPSKSAKKKKNQTMSNHVQLKKRGVW